MTNQTKAFCLAGLTVLSWSTVSTAFKVALEALTPVQLIYTGMGTAALFLLAVMTAGRRLGEFRAMRGRHWRWSGMLGVLLYLYYTVLFVAYDYLPAQICQPVNYTWALILALLASWLMRQRLTAMEFFWMVFAYSGVVVITAGAGDELGPLHPVGILCVLASTVLYAVYWILNTRSKLPSLPGLTVCFAVSFTLAAATLMVRGEALTFPVRPLLGGVYVGLFELAVPFLLWGAALRLTTSVARLSTLLFIIPFLALFWIHLIIHEPVTWTTVAGLAVIVTGIVMQQRLAARRQPVANQDSDKDMAGRTDQA